MKRLTAASAFVACTAGRSAAPMAPRSDRATAPATRESAPAGAVPDFPRKGRPNVLGPRVQFPLAAFTSARPTSARAQGPNHRFRWMR
jgi:hypothetical protein